MDSNNGSFWPSYVDVMTTLFAITLVLFAVSFSRFKVTEKYLQNIVNEYKNILDVYSAVGAIDSTCYFEYNEQYLKHLFTVDVEYQTREYRIDHLKLDLTDTVAANEIRRSVLAAGRLIKNTIERIEESEQDPNRKNNIKFLVVIEGQSSRVRFNDNDWMNNYTLSYLRALYLNRFWQENGIDLGVIPRCELIVSGSGEGGVPRVEPEPGDTDWKMKESKNQRFLIHVVPVIGNIDVTQSRIQVVQGKK